MCCLNVNAQTNYEYCIIITMYSPVVVYWWKDNNDDDYYVLCCSIMLQKIWVFAKEA